MFKLCLSIHVFCAFLSLLLLIIRGRLQIKGKDWRSSVLLRALPHASDTFLILSGIALWYLSGIGLAWWLLVKIGLLIEYVIFSAKFFGRNAQPKNNSAFFFALLCLSCAVLLAYYH